MNILEYHTFCMVYITLLIVLLIVVLYIILILYTFRVNCPNFNKWRFDQLEKRMREEEERNLNR